jgi:PPP family 3-phenylpropionic acid transporter
MKRVTPFTFNILYYAAAAFLLPFVVLYYQQLGFTGAQIGLLAGMAPLLTLIGAPLWTGIADATRHHRLIMTLAIAVAVVAGLIFPTLKTLGPVIVVVILSYFFAAPIVSFADSATMSMLEDEKELYGRVRIGGSIGWGLAAPIAGMLIQAYGLKMAFWGYAVLMFLGLIVSQRFIHGKSGESISFGGSFRTLLADYRWILFLALAFLSGVGFASTNYYLFPYLKELKASETMMGFALTIATLSELPVFFFAGRLIKHFKAHGLLMLGMVITGVRLLLFATFNFVAGILIVQILQGLTLPIVWVAGVSYADEHAPAGMSATAQGLFGAMVYGFGAAAGGFVGGLLLDSIGSRGMYFVFGAIVLAGLGIVTLIERRLPAEQHG